MKTATIIFALIALSFGIGCAVLDALNKSAKADFDRKFEAEMKATEDVQQRMTQSFAFVRRELENEQIKVKLLKELLTEKLEALPLLPMAVALQNQLAQTERAQAAFLNERQWKEEAWKVAREAEREYGKMSHELSLWITRSNAAWEYNQP